MQDELLGKSDVVSATCTAVITRGWAGIELGSTRKSVSNTKTNFGPSRAFL